MNKPSKKLFVVILIILIVTSITTFLGNFIHNNTPNKYFINYMLFPNKNSIESMTNIDRRLFEIETKRKDFDITFQVYIDQVVNDEIELLLEDNEYKSLFTGINDFAFKIRYLRFQTDNIQNIDERVDNLLTVINDKISSMLDTKIEYYLLRIIDKEKFSQKTKIAELSSNIEKIELLQNESSDISQDESKRILAKAITYYLLNNELKIGTLFPGNRTEKLNFEYFIPEGLIMQNLFKKDFDKRNIKTLISILNSIKNDKIKNLQNFDQTYLPKNYLYQQIKFEKETLSKLTFIKRGPKNVLNKKPSRTFMILSFFFAGFFLSLIFIYFYLNALFLKRMINKKLKVLLYLK